MPGISSLPVELKGSVLDNLEDRKDLMNAAFMSREWVQPATSRLFRRMNQPDLEYLIRKVPQARQQERANQIRHLTCCTLRRTLLTGQFRPQLNTLHLNFRDLRTLHFFHPSSVEAAGSNLNISQFLGPRLRELTVEGVMMLPPRAANPDNYLLNMHLAPNIRELKLERCIQGATPQHLKQALLALKKLETVCLTTRMNVLVDYQVQKTLAEMDKLTDIRLGTPFTGWNTSTLVQTVRHPFANVSIADLVMDSEAARHLLPEMTSLEELTLDLKTPAPIFNSAIRFLPELQDLDLTLPWTTTLTYDDLQGLQTCHNLTSLSLTAPFGSICTPTLTAAEVYMLFSPLSGLEYLTLHLRESKISSTDMLNMIGGFCPRLQALNLETGWRAIETAVLIETRVLFPELRGLWLPRLVLPQGELLKMTKHPAVGDVCFGAISAHNALREHCPKVRKFVCGRRFGANVGWFDGTVTKLMDYTCP